MVEWSDPKVQEDALRAYPSPEGEDEELILPSEDHFF